MDNLATIANTQTVAAVWFCIVFLLPAYVGLLRLIWRMGRRTK
jgi:hypothetical protein